MNKKKESKYVGYYVCGESTPRILILKDEEERILEYITQRFKHMSVTLLPVEVSVSKTTGNKHKK